MPSLARASGQSTPAEPDLDRQKYGTHPPHLLTGVQEDACNRLCVLTAQQPDLIARWNDRWEVWIQKIGIAVPNFRSIVRDLDVPRG